MLQEWPPVRRLAWPRAQAAIEWRSSSSVRHQQTRRSLLTHLIDPWRTCRSRPGQRQEGSTKPLARKAARTTACQHRCRCTRQQECTDRLGLAVRRRCLRSWPNGWIGLRPRSIPIPKGGPTTQLQQSAEDGENGHPSLPEPGVWTGMASANVSEPLRWKRAKTHRGSRHKLASRIRKPDIRQQLTFDPESTETCCDRAGSIYVHTWALPRRTTSVDESLVPALSADVTPTSRDWCC
jgi:hypothetical protein